MAVAEKPALGMIDCPHCGEVGGMAVKHDKNGEPFGHCEECSGQLRVGGKPGRVRKFCRLYPWAAAAVASVTAPAVPVTVTVTEEKPAPATEPPPVTATPTAPPPRRKATFADALAILGGK